MKEKRWRGDFSYSIGEVVTYQDYEAMVYDELVKHDSSREHEPQEEEGIIKEEPLTTLRESNHG